MPKRSTQKQRIVYLLRQALAPATWTVTESKMLCDPVLKRDRRESRVAMNDRGTTVL